MCGTHVRSVFWLVHSGQCCIGVEAYKLLPERSMKRKKEVLFDTQCAKNNVKDFP